MLKKKINKLILIFFILVLGLALSNAEIMPLKDVKIGMKGKGKTAVEGNKIIEFDVEIISVLKNVFPKKSIIIARLGGEDMERAGISQGMSGSPVYIDNKLIGAVAYSFPFSKEAVAGITPVEDMMESDNSATDAGFISSNFNYHGLMKFISSLGDYKGSEELLSDFMNNFSISAGSNESNLLKPVPILLYKGMKPFSSVYEQWWRERGFIPIMAAGGAADIKVDSIKEGNAIGVVFLSGDLEIGGIGTVTYVDKNRIYAFGHPMFNLGNIALPMAEAEIQAVIPNMYSSFKIGNIGKTIGTFKQDLSSAVFGFLNEEPPLIPMKLKINTGKSTKDYNFKLAEHNLLTPLIANIALNESFGSTELNYYEGTYEVSGTIEIDGYQNITIDNIFAGFLSIDQSTTYIASIIGYMLNNEFDKIKVKSIDLSANIDQEQRIAEIKQIKYDKSDVKRGDKIRLEILLKPYLKEAKIYNYDIDISAKLRKGMYYVYVGGAMDLNKIDYESYYNMISIDNLKQVIKLINSIKKNNKIYIRVVRPSTSIIVKNRLLNNMPPSHFDIVFSSQTVGEVNRIWMEPVLEDSIDSNYMIKGMKSFVLNVKD